MMKFSIPRKMLWTMAMVFGLSAVIGFLLLENSMRPVLIPLIVGIATLLFFSAYAYIELSSRLSSHHDLVYRQTEALFGIHSVLHPRLPLPSMRGWTILPDAAAIIISNILSRKPNFILECGSGVSTILCGYSLERLNSKGKILSIDHEAYYGSLTAKTMEKHGFSSDMFKIVHAPLITHKNDSKPFIWYDTSFLSLLTNPVDLLIVDGPPHKTQYKARYPAMAFLFEKLSDNAVIILDDGSRQDEKAIVEQWLSEYPSLKLEFHDTEKGVAVLTKTSGA